MKSRLEKGVFIRECRLTGDEKRDREIMDNLVRSLRSCARLSQPELGSRIGVSQPRISQHESGEPTQNAPITLKRLVAIARECGYDVRIAFEEKKNSESGRTDLE